MTNYDQEINKASKSKCYSNSDIFDFRGTPDEDLYSDFYNFCRDNLDTLSKKKLISPNFFIFSNEFEKNARATKTKEGIYGIKINMGLFKYCIDEILENKKLNKYFESRYPEITNLFGNYSVSKLSFEIALQFSYYHELGHLMQFTGYPAQSLNLDERPSGDSYFNINSHKKETNADHCASIAIASHIQQYAENRFGEEMDSLKLSKLVKILLSSLLNYVLIFYNDLTIFYLDEKSHPHPIVRMINIGLFVIECLNQSEFLKKKNIILEIHELEAVFDLYKDLEKEEVYKTNLGIALEKLFNKKEEITNYLITLNNFDVNQSNNALEISNILED